METSWKYLAQEILTPSKLFESNLEYLERATAAPVIALNEENDIFALRQNIGRMKDVIVHQQIKVALSQGTLLITWQVFELSISTMADELSLSLKSRKGEMLALPERFLQRVQEKYSLSSLSLIPNSELWRETARIRKIRNDVAHEGGIFSRQSKNLNEVERRFIEPMTDEQLESGEIWGPINFPVDALKGYAETLSGTIRMIGQHIEARPC